MITFLFWFVVWLVSVFVTLVLTFKIYEAKKIQPKDYWNDWPHPLFIAIFGPVTLVVLVVMYFFQWFTKIAKKTADSFKISISKKEEKSQ